jgi:DNA mismatch repair protein MutH
MAMEVKEDMAVLFLELLTVAIQSIGLALTAMFPLTAPLTALLTLI